MRDREGLDLTGPLALWNLFMSLFSTYMGLPIVAEYWPRITDQGLNAVCNANFYNQTGPLPSSGLARSLFLPPASLSFRRAGAWFVFLFNMTKVFEWVDTIFLVVRVTVKRERNV